MNYLQMRTCDVANGPGVRVSLWVSGCRCHCPGCQNPGSWDFAAGQPFSLAQMRELDEAINKPYIQGLTITGGHPLEPENTSMIYILLQAIKQDYPSKDIWLYTGLLWEDIIKNPEYLAIAKLCDVVVDGPYREAERDISLLFRGSKNQRLIDVNKTLEKGKVVLYE